MENKEIDYRIEKNLAKIDKLTKLGAINKRQEILVSLIAKVGKCDKCWRTDNLTLDHIVPVDILRQMGFDTERFTGEEDFRLLCKSCNNFKGNQLDFSTPATKKLLLKYLEKL